MEPPASLTLRDATPDDAAPCVAIYAHHVVHGFASFDTEPPPVAYFEQRIAQVRAAGWPWLVAEVAGEAIAGYAYATQIRDRPGYRFTCEDSIYVAHDRRGQGVGRALLGELVARCERLGFRQMIAVVGGGEPASLALHRRLGFEEVGRLRSVGWKLGAWRDSVYLQRSLGAGDRHPGAEEG